MVVVKISTRLIYASVRTTSGEGLRVSVNLNIL